MVKGSVVWKSSVISKFPSLVKSVSLNSKSLFQAAKFVSYELFHKKANGDLTNYLSYLITEALQQWGTNNTY